MITRYTGEDYGNNKSKDRVMPAQIPELAKQNFPLCMKSMQEVLEICFIRYIFTSFIPRF